MYSKIAERPPVGATRSNRKVAAIATKAPPRRFAPGWWVGIILTMSIASATLNAIGWLGGDGGLGGLKAATTGFEIALVVATAIVMVVICYGLELVAGLAPMMAGQAREDHLRFRRYALVALAVAAAYGWNLYSAEKALAYRNHFAEAAVERSFEAQRAPLVAAIRTKEGEITDLLKPVENPYKAQLDAINAQLNAVKPTRRNTMLLATLGDQQVMASMAMRNWETDQATQVRGRQKHATAQIEQLKADLAAIDAEKSEAIERAVVKTVSVGGIQINMQLWIAFLLETIKLVAVWAGSVYNRNGRAAR